MRKFSLGMALLALAACGGTNTAREMLGFERNSPDEFAVVSRPPLSVPPEFNLRPPLDGRDTTNLPAADEHARALLTGGATPDSPLLGSPEADTAQANTKVGAVSVSPASSPAEAEFLNRAGTGKAQADIRTRIQKDSEVVVVQKKDKSWWDFSEDKDPTVKTVDAEGEKARLKTNAATGKPITAGDTPSEKEKDRGIFSGWF